MSASLVLTGLGGLLHLLHPNYVMLLGIYALWGFTSLFAFWPSLLKSLREIAGADEQSKAYGFMEGGRGIVYAVDAVIILALFSHFSKVSSDLAGLNGVIIYYSAVAIGLGVLLFFLMKEKQETVETMKEEKEKVTLQQVIEVVKMPQIWLLSLIMCCTYTMNLAFYYFTPYATSHFGMAAAAGAVVTMAAQYVRPVASFGGGIIADRIGRSKVMYVTFTLMAVPALLMIFMQGMSQAVFIILCILTYAGMYGGSTMVFSMMDEGGIPLKVSGTACGFVCTVGYLPEIIVPFCAGSALDAFGENGYRYIFIAIAVIMIVGIMMVRVWENFVRRKKQI